MIRIDAEDRFDMEEIAEAPGEPESSLPATSRLRDLPPTSGRMVLPRRYKIHNPEDAAEYLGFDPQTTNSTTELHQGRGKVPRRLSPSFYCVKERRASGERQPPTLTTSCRDFAAAGHAITGHRPPFEVYPARGGRGSLANLTGSTHHPPVD